MKTRSMESKLLIDNVFTGTQHSIQVKNHTVYEELIIGKGQREYATRLDMKDGSTVVVESGGELNVGYTKNLGKTFVVDDSTMPEGHLLWMGSGANITVEDGAILRFRDPINIEEIDGIHNYGRILVGEDAHTFVDFI